MMKELALVAAAIGLAVLLGGGNGGDNGDNGDNGDVSILPIDDPDPVREEEDHGMGEPRGSL